MSKRQQGSSRGNKSKSHQSPSIADKSLFTKDLLDQVNKDSLTSGVSTSTSLPSWASSSQLHQRRSSGLEDIDHDDHQQEDEDKGQRRTTKQKSHGKSSKQFSSVIKAPTATTTTTTIRNPFSRLTSLSSWANNTQEQETTNLWTWATSSRAISYEQRRQEDQKEAFSLARHQLDLQTRFSITFSDISTKDQQHHDWEQKSKKKVDGHATIDAADGNGTSAEREKESAKNSWNSIKRTAAFDLTTRDCVALSALTVATLGVRFWRISWPDEVILDEVMVGQLVNGYAKSEFVLDAHPPLGKMILAGVSSLSNYRGSFDFEDIGDQYPGWVPYASMRATMALMGALCAPMAYATLKASGHGAPAAILATTLVAFDNALTANNRMLTLDAPLMFFTAATIMSWNMFIKQSARPFTGFWWTWLLATGISMAGAMSVKLVGIVSAVTTLYFMSLNLWTLARDKSVNTGTWMKHFVARVGALVALPLTLYLFIFHIHFTNETHQPDYRTSPRAESDLDQLSRLYRHSLISHYPTEDHVQTWRDVVYGSVVQIQSEAKAYAGGVGNVYLHSSAELNPGGTRQQVVSGYSYPDINTHWIIIKAEIDSADEPEEIPSRLELVKNGDLVRLRHVSTRKCLHSHNHRTYTNLQNDKLNEVSGYGGHGFDGDSNDWWVVEIVDAETLREGPKSESEPIRALETTFRLRHYEIGCFLFASDSSLPEPWGEGRSEIICRTDARVTEKSIWRFANNRHDYLPADTPKTSYPKPSFWAKFKEMHKLMWSYQSPPEENLQISSSNPRQWPFGQAMILAWSGYQRQMAIVANPVVWWTSAMGLVVYLASMAIFAVRHKRGYFETGRLGEFQRFHLSDAGTYFTGWAFHYIPFFFIDRILYLHHYFPALYFSILLTSSLLSGLSGFLPRPARFALFTTISILAVATFIRLAPLSYGSEMTREKCEAVGRWVNPRNVRGGFGNELDCSLAPLAIERPQLLSVLKEKAKVKKALLKRQRQKTKTVEGQGFQLTNNVAAGPIPTATTTGAAAANNFMTAEAPIPDSPFAAAGTNPLTPGYNGKTRLSVTKPQPKLRAPILPMRLPPVKRRLPVSDIVLLPYQQPPQHWDQNAKNQMMQREDLNLYEQLQIQQLVSGEYQRLNNDEDDESSNEEDKARAKGGNKNQDQGNNQNQIRDDENGRVEQQRNQAHQQLENNIHKSRPLAHQNDPRLPPPAPQQMDAEIDKVLSRFQERNRQAAAATAAAYHQIRLPHEQIQVEDDEAGMDHNVYDRLARPPLENANAEGGAAAVGVEGGSGGGRGGGVSESKNINGTQQQQPRQDKHHTMGLAQPLKFEAGKAYKRRQKMMDAAIAAAAAAKQADSLNQGQYQDQDQGVKGFLNAAADDQNELRKKMTDEEKEVVRREKEERMKKRRETKEERDRMLVERMRLRALAKEQAKAAASASEAEEVEEVGEGDQEEVVDNQDTNLSAVAPQQEGYQLLQQQQDDAYYGSDGYNDDDNEVDEEQEVEMRGPPISVGSAEELERVLKQLQEEGVRAEVVRGAVTETIEAPAIVTPVSPSSAMHDDQYENDGGYNDDYEEGEEEDEGELPPPIAVKNAEELASVLEKLAADGVRAEVVQGDLTRYVEPPMASV